MKFLREKKVFILCLSLLLLILISNIIAVFNNCLSSYDLGLYYQALVNMADGDINPYLTIRTLNIFNDHFEPILFLAVPSVILTGYSPVGPVVFEWIIFCLFIYGLIKLSPKKDATLIFFLCLFSRGILTALNFPIHPNTWSILSWLALVYFIQKGNLRFILLSAFSLIFYRESNVFGLIGLLFFYLTSLDKKKIAFSLLTAIAGLFIIFKLRPFLVGETYDYGGVFIKGILKDHLFFVFERLKLVDYSSFLKVFIPLILPVYLTLRKESKPFIRTNFFQLICILGPIFFLHLLAGKIHYHYGITFVAPLLCYFILSPSFSSIFENKKTKIFILLTFFVTSTSTYTRWFKQSLFNKSRNCVIDSKKRASTNRLRLVIDKNMNENHTLFSSNRVVPLIVKEKRKIYVPSHFTNHLPSYDFILLEKRDKGLVNSLSEVEYKEAMVKCKVGESETLYDDQYYLLVKGEFVQDCFKLFSSL